MVFRLLIIAILFSGSAFASSRDTIIVHKDPRLDIFTAKQASINKVTARMSSNGLFKGYRLQVLNTRSRDDAFKTKAMLLENFPDEKTYVLYQSPYFKVRIGNFVNRNDAENFKKELSLFITQPAYVVEDLIEYIPRADEF
ncbi:MAG TPA: SPOR domain-containing protein [Parafilimonas sp.]|nr:SPOR domain-containing protein [Parafilimonas sp.]